MLVAVYGTLKKGRGNHHVMENSGGSNMFLTTTKREYTMHDGGFPKVVKGNTSRIGVEVYEVEYLAHLDYLEGHPTHFKRELVELEGTDKTAWMYIYQYEPTSNIIHSGVW